MTDRVKGFHVILDHDIRDDDVEGLRQAILHLRCVENVSSVLVTPDDWMGRERAKLEIRDKILDLLIPVPSRNK